MFKTLLAKELREQVRTSKLLIFGAVFLISGIISPVLAKYTPALLKAIPDLPAGFAALIPTPTLQDAVAQYVKNASQFGLLLVVLLTMGVMAQEKERGTAAMLLTKPVKRSAVVLAKWLAGMTTLAASVVAGAFGCLVYTAVLFGGLPLDKFALLNGLMIVFFGVYLAVTLLASTLARTQAMAAMGAFAGLVILLLLSALPRVGDFFPNALLTWGSLALAGGKQTYWPALWIGLGLIAAALGGACLSFERQEI